MVYSTLGAIWIMIGIGATLMGGMKPDTVYIGVLLFLILLKKNG